MSSATEQSSDSDSPGSIAEFLTGSSSESEGSYSDSEQESVSSSVIKSATSQEDYMSDPVEPLLLESDAEEPVVPEPAKKPATKKKAAVKRGPWKSLRSLTSLPKLLKLLTLPKLNQKDLQKKSQRKLLP